MTTITTTRRTLGAITVLLGIGAIVWGLRTGRVQYVSPSALESTPAVVSRVQGLPYSPSLYTYSRDPTAARVETYRSFEPNDYDDAARALSGLRPGDAITLGIYRQPIKGGDALRVVRRVQVGAETRFDSTGLEVGLSTWVSAIGGALFVLLGVVVLVVSRRDAR
jgi:hypothetical protein